MKFCNYYPPGVEEGWPQPGVLLEGAIYPLEQLVAKPVGLRGAGIDGPLPIGFSIGGHNNIELLDTWKQEVEAGSADTLGSVTGHKPERCALFPPVFNPTSFRDFYAFEQHVKTARGRRGLEIVPEWYDSAVFYFSNHSRFIGAGHSLHAPAGGKWLDFELEVAAIITRGGSNLTPEQAEECIGGYAVLNDWSLRDVQRQEMKVGLGPAKGKDFATGLGPWLVTPDEIADRRSGKGFNLEMTASINGRQVSRGSWKDIHYSFGEMISRASTDAAVLPGDIIGSGTVGTGCILELGPENTDGWLKPGDLVELTIEQLGTLRTPVIAAPDSENGKKE